MAFGAFEGQIKAFHPCFGGEEGARYGRLHLPVSPRCNICCRFCSRGLGLSDNRPGVAAELLTRSGALETVKKALWLCPDITVVGIAGPGDPLATDDAVEVFGGVGRLYPKLIRCLSTNGLMLPRYADALKGVGVTSVTVTVNAVDSNVLKDIISAVTYDGTVYGGVRGAEILIRNQLDGIRLASKFAVVKVNTVLIPGVNDSHIGDIAKAAALAGANMYNIIPLIPQGEFQNTPPPDCRMLAEARETAEEYLPVFKHCKRCRADACGIPGVSEYAPSLYKNATETFSHG